MIVLFFILYFVLPVQTGTLTARELPDEFSINIPGDNRNITLTAPVILNDKQDVYSLGLHLEILKDPSGKLTIDEITSPEFEGKFILSNKKTPNFGFTNSAYWVRFQIRNETEKTENWLLKLGFANMQHIELFLPVSDEKGYIHTKTGTYHPFDTRDISDKKFIFKIPLKFGDEQIIYMRFKNDASITLPLTLSSTETFYQKSKNEQLLSGLFYGILLLILFYSLIVFFLLPEKSYLYYILSVVSFILFYVSYDGSASQYLWPAHPSWNHFAITFLHAVTFIFILKFTSAFLETKTRFPLFNKTLTGWMVIWGLLILMIPVFRYGIVVRPIVIFTVLCLITILVMGFISWRKKFRSARYFMFACLASIISVSIVEMVRLGVLPSNTFTEHGYQAGLILLVFLLSMALADKRIQALKESEEKYRNVVERANDMIAIIQDSKIKYVNQKAVDSLGYPLSNLLNKNFIKFVHPDEYDILIERNRRRFSGEKISDTYETILVDKKGHLINVIMSGGLIDYEGKPANLVIMHDITKRKKAEEEIKRSEEKYRVFFKTSTDCVYITSKDGKWLDMSDNAPEFFGYESKEELKRVNIRELYKNPSDRELDMSEVEQQGFTKDVMFNLKKKDSSIIKALISSVAIKDNDGNVVAFQGSIRDITAQKEAEITLKENQKYLKELNASKDKFFSIISHDLRSPFNSILGFTELLWKNSGDFSKAEIEKIAYDIYKTGNETIDLLNNLLEWSSSQTGKLKINAENFFLKSVIDDTIDLLNEYAIKKNITVLNEVPGQIKVFADKNMINSVTRNLLSNAIKFTQNGDVRITAKDVNSFMECTITDTGVGMNPEDIKKLFRLDTEFSTPGTANEKGSGLGLILCKEFIEKNHGEIYIESKKGKGTSFMFKLPSTQ
ncbi:MAG: PAS domain S-box protein [Bacteroidetes bacterium]|nr:PAS domain S-box protein [Bacteroidota bacterium]